ncbi:helix-turn-helix domain-containing protein [Propionibacterium australiense]|uniref:Cro/C1-type HTH domain profile n=1 Tax=Propionibacterium australiense TaxID=119981 RepID=A0A383S8R3_9ACTN|nr:helix-turn-helix domain-containing protein [Propionibacterium australiense]RLP07127.1 helix-turn-helix domain-containing protein [Propionibacterium australiense]RLP07895.1 helix-turn-helix domain-containing protein [Propionibacterium australiense]SYZ33769.1 Cro/C1-type HTH domain profile [Propionibacterium australiense]VEH88746.1 HTH-type transcriptional regulator immR [Propionibacterium australiense]
MTPGEKIQRLRRQQGLSQEALAERITVTRQTISKWELNQSSPDLFFIAQLSDIFNVSSDYLIKDDMVEPDELPVRKRNYRLSERSRRILLVSFSAAALTAICVCLICDYFTADELSWSLIAATSIVAGWLILIPGLTARTRPVLRTLLMASIVPVPLLALLSVLLQKSVILTLGACISLVAVATLWAVYGIFRRFWPNWYRAAGFSLLVMIPVPIAITHLAAAFLQQGTRDLTSEIFNSAITLVLALVCFGLDFVDRHRMDEEADQR